MSQILDEFQKIISESNIPTEDQNDILVVLPSIPEQAIGVMNTIFKTDPKMITEFNKSFKAKVRALTNQDDKEWEDILQKEREQIDGLDADNQGDGDSDTEAKDDFN